jgi:hypothetical protein
LLLKACHEKQEVILVSAVGGAHDFVSTYAPAAQEAGVFRSGRQR